MSAEPPLNPPEISRLDRIDERLHELIEMEFGFSVSARKIMSIAVEIEDELALQEQLNGRDIDGDNTF
jgi:hypothetical protein